MQTARHQNNAPSFYTQAAILAAFGIIFLTFAGYMLNVPASHDARVRIFPVVATVLGLGATSILAAFASLRIALTA